MLQLEAVGGVCEEKSVVGIIRENGWCLARLRVQVRDTSVLVTLQASVASALRTPGVMP